MADPQKWPELDKAHWKRMKEIELTDPTKYTDPEKQYEAIKQHYAGDQETAGKLCKVADARRHEAQIEEQADKKAESLYSESREMSIVEWEAKEMKNKAIRDNRFREPEGLASILEEVDKKYERRRSGVRAKIRAQTRKGARENLSQEEKKVLEDFQPDMTSLFPGGYDDILINCKDRYIIKEDLFWQNAKFGLFVIMDKVSTEILGGAPIRFQPRDVYFLDEGHMTTYMNSRPTSHGNGMFFSPDDYITSFAQREREGVKQGDNIIGPVVGGGSLPDEPLISHNPIHECGHAMMHTITYFFYKQLEKPLGLKAEDYFMCRSFIERIVKQKLRTDVEKELGYIPGDSALETDNTRALEGMSNHGVIGGPGEWNAESHVNSQLAQENAQNGEIKMMAYGRALNKLYQKGLDKFAEDLANDVMTKEGYRKFRLHQEFCKRGHYTGTQGWIDGLYKTWFVFCELLGKEPYSRLAKTETEARKLCDIVHTLVAGILEDAMDEVSATKEINALLQSLYDVQQLQAAGKLDIVKMYNEQKDKIKKNVFYQELPEDSQRRCVLEKVFDMCKLESQKLKENEHANAPMVILGTWASKYNLPTLAQIDEEWKTKFGTLQSQQAEPSVQETEDKFTTHLRTLLADAEYMPTIYNNPLNLPNNEHVIKQPNAGIPITPEMLGGNQSNEPALMRQPQKDIGDRAQNGKQSSANIP